MTRAARLIAGLARYRVALTVLVTALVGLAGFVALYHLVAKVRLADVRLALAALPADRLWLCAAFTAASYLALTFYDVLALRIAGLPLTYRTAALASFTSYTLSHNLGLSLLTGGSARLRIYSVAGLKPADIARVILTAGLGFWSGVFVLAGVALALQNHVVAFGSIAIWPVIQNRLGWSILAAEAVLIALSARGHRSVSLLGWKLPLPTPREAALQVAVSAIDLAAASAALFVLVPGLDIAAYPMFFLAYALAIVVALISHVPGGIGIFEGVMVAALPGVDPASLFAALILYRVIYYLLPLALGALLFVLHEGARWRRPLASFAAIAQDVVAVIAPAMIAILVFLGGVVLLFSGALPAVPDRMHALHAILPLPFLEASHVAGSLTGTALLLLAPGLYRRLDGAFLATRALLIAGAVFSMLKGIDYEEAVVMLTITAVLQWMRPAFYRRARLTADALTPGWLLTIAAAVGMSIWIGLFAYKHVIYSNDLWWNFAHHANTSRSLRGSFAAAVLLVGVAIWRLLGPARPFAGRGPLDQPDIGPALARAERTDAFLALSGDKHCLMSPSGGSFLMYQVRGRSWIAMGDPVGSEAEWPDLLWRLRETADAAGGRLLLYRISQDCLPIAIDLGLQLVKYGEEARVDLSTFTLEGPTARAIRQGARRAAREGATFEIVARAGLPSVLDRLRVISDEWLESKGHREKGFSVGRFDPAYLLNFDCAVIRREGQVIAFANVLATANKQELSVDLMRHIDAIPAGTMDLLFASLMQWGQGHGYRWFTLGLAPLSGLEARRLAPLWARAGSWLYRHGGAWYGFEGLRIYKEKFLPKWEPRYIAGPHGIGMARALIDLQVLIAADVKTVRSIARNPQPTNSEPKTDAPVQPLERPGRAASAMQFAQAASRA